MLLLFRNIIKVKYIKFNPISSFSIFSKIFTSKNNQSKPQNTFKPQNQNQTQKKLKQDHLQKQQIQPYDLYQRKKQIQMDVDFAKLRQNFKGIPQDVGKGGIQEIIYWSDGVQNMDQVLILLRAFNKVMGSNSALQIPKQYKFVEFKKKVIELAFLCRDFESIKIFAEFGFLFAVQQQQFWKKLQQKFIKKINKFDDIKIILEIFQMFSYAKKGNQIYYHIAQLVKFNQQIITAQQVCVLIYGFFNVRLGDKQFIEALIKSYYNNINKIQKDYLLLVMPILRNVQKIQKQIFEALEKRLMLEISNLTLSELCKIAESFGYQRGSDDFWIQMEQKMKTFKLDLVNINKFVYGFMTSYRCSEQLIQANLPVIKQNLFKIHPKQLSQISKCLYIYQFTDKQLYNQIQQIIIEYLRDVQFVDFEVLTIIAKNYSVTRHGSRDIYKMLEVVIMDRLPYIKNDRNVFESLLTIYLNSDLCSIELINMLKSLS